MSSVPAVGTSFSSNLTDGGIEELFELLVLPERCDLSLKSSEATSGVEEVVSTT